MPSLAQYIRWKNWLFIVLQRILMSDMQMNVTSIARMHRFAQTLWICFFVCLKQTIYYLLETVNEIKKKTQSEMSKFAYSTGNSFEYEMNYVQCLSSQYLLIKLFRGVDDHSCFVDVHKFFRQYQSIKWWVMRQKRKPVCAEIFY